MSDSQKANASSPCPSSYALDKSRLFPTSDDMTGHLDSCRDCHGRLEAIRASESEFHDNVFSQTLSAVTERILDEQRRPRKLPKGNATMLRRILPLGIAAAATLLLAVGLLPGKPRDGLIPGSTPMNDEDISDKGAVGLELYCKRNDRVFRVHQGTTLRSDDMIRFVPVLSNDGPRYIMVVSVDGLGTVSKYFPQDSDTALRVHAMKAALPGSIVLDNTPGPEHVWLLSSKTPFRYSEIVTTIRRAWTRAGASDRMDLLPLNLEQVGLVFFKETAR